MCIRDSLKRVQSREARRRDSTGTVPARGERPRRAGAGAARDPTPAFADTCAPFDGGIMIRRIGLLMIAVCTIVAQPARAQSDLGFKRAGVALAMVSPENVDASFGLGVFADHGTIAPRWGLELSLIHIS